MQGGGTNFAKVMSLLGALVATSVVLGLLGAGLVMPAVGATGAIVRQGVHVFDTLPSDFALTPLSQQSRILASNGTLISTPYDENRIIVPLARIAPVMRQAQIAIEDSRFYEHGGIDPLGVGRAFISNLGGGSTQGASTLTQQYVKITLQENALNNNDKLGARAATARSYTRKLQELKYAVTLEKNLTKNQILEGYLNIVYYGGQAYGVEAAARHFFGVSAAQLNLPQAATLAGLVQAPSLTDPISNPARALVRRNVVLDRMHTLKLITDKAWIDAKATKMVTHSLPAQNSCALSPYSYFCTYVTAWLEQLPALGKTVAERKRTISRGGLTIQTTLNPKMQGAAQQELTAKIPIGNSDGVGAAAAVIEPGTGNVLAIAQNTTYAIKTAPGKTAINWAVDRKYGGSGGFSYGSTAKLFAVAEALRSGMPINSTVIARAAGPNSPAVFTHADFPGACGIGQGQVWNVHNDEGSRNGAISLTDAAAFSVNTAFAGLVSKLGACNVRDMMTNLGLHTGSGNPISNFPAPITLGSDSVAPLTLASAYATIASGGTYCVPSPVLTISTNDKKLLPLPKNQCRKALEPDVANGVTTILKNVLTKGTGYGNSLANGRPAAGKTGTSENSNQTWFVGYTPQLATAVWVGTPYGPISRELNNLNLGGKFYGGQIFGATVAAPTWKAIMDTISASLPPLDFAAPAGTVQFGNLVSIPRVYGMPVSAALAALTAAGFQPVVGIAVSSNIQAGLVVGTQPSSQAPSGSTVTLYTSTGVSQAPPAPNATPGVKLLKCSNPRAQPPPNCKP
jgi:membrane peptidoglycan carboxypeptidase